MNATQKDDLFDPDAETLASEAEWDAHLAETAQTAAEDREDAIEYEYFLRGHE